MDKDMPVVVPSGQALKMAQKWLGITDAAQVLASAPEDENFTKPRPVGLGLGAKYLPHHKAVALTAGVEQRLGKKLKRAAAVEAEKTAARLQAGPGAAPAGAEGSGDEDEGRAALFKGPRQSAKKWNVTRTDMVAEPAQATSSKPKKRKRKKAKDPEGG